jgi:glycosyltransferase involved in cell wall biosynthesis
MEAPPPVETNPEDVTATIRRDAPQDYVATAEQVNASGTDLVSVQHEFGIFGGPEGLYLTEFLDRLEVPAVTTLHTVLPEPSLPYHRALRAVAHQSDHLVVISEAAHRLLDDVYGIDPATVTIIPHGVPDVPIDPSASQKEALGFSGRTVLFTFGLLNPGKGIEFMLNALPNVVRDHPEILYVVLGATHPEVRRQQGEVYREDLKKQVETLGLTGHVQFVNRFVSQTDLLQYLRACDIYVTPYPGRDQVSSGTLAYALGAGTAIVSTPYLYAEEMLADGAGRLVPYGDTETLTSTLRDLVADDEARALLGQRAYEVGQSMTWPKVGRRYADLFDEVMATGRSVEARPQRPDLPAISLGHLVRLTDETGLFQHAPFGVPDRHHGYCTDDVGRALVVVLRHGHETGAPSTLPLVRTYLSFLHHAQHDDGTFRNFMSYDRRFVDETPSEDTTGRALWGLGAAAAWAPTPALRQIARQMLERARSAEFRHPHALAYGICGLALYLRRHGEASQTRSRLTAWAEQLAGHYRAARDPEWPWFHDALTYGNALLPLAMLETHLATGRPEFLSIGKETLDFLLEVTFCEDGYFDFVGSEGWYPRDGAPARFAQQSIEAGYTAEACAVAFEVTGKERYRDLTRAAADWFSGRNRLGTALYNPATGACSDGLELYGASFNQGAESVIACLLGLQAAGAPLYTDRIPVSPSQARDTRPSTSSSRSTRTDHGPIRT